MNPLKILSHDVVYRGKVFDLEVDQIEYPSGNRGVREVARHPGGAVMVPVFPDGTVLLVSQFRYPFQTYSVEVPAGKLNPGEDPLVACNREMEEETGWIAGKIEKLTALQTTPGFCDEVLHIYLGTDLKPAPDGHHREEGEIGMSVHAMSIDQAIELIDSGVIRDSKTIVGLFLAQRALARTAFSLESAGRKRPPKRRAKPTRTLVRRKRARK
jgi:ADP-ribose pyrophosphatase